MTSDKEFLVKKVEALEAENRRLRFIIRSAYENINDTNDVACFLGDALEELGYEFDDAGALIDEDDE